MAEDTRNPEICDEERCDPPYDKARWYCADCRCSFCDYCWSRVAAHRRNRGGHRPHEKIDFKLAQRFEKILFPPKSNEVIRNLHEKDERSTWFGVDCSEGRDYALKIHSTFAEIIAYGQRPQHETRFPYLVSFIGQTGAGKSTLVKMLITAREANLRPVPPEFPSPVVGSSVNDRIATSADVHLYGDPATFYYPEPILYADCEGLNAGQERPRADVSQGTEQQHRSRIREMTYRFLNTRTRKIEWKGPGVKKTREFAVTELYPRVMYTFSDVVVFVLQNQRVFQSAALKPLLKWGDFSIDKSIGQPILPHVIIAVNSTALDVDDDEWDPESAKDRLLDSVKNSLKQEPEFKELVKKWEERKRPIKTVSDLIHCYYSSFSVVRIPVAGQYGRMNDQVNKLYRKIIEKCTDSHVKKATKRMLSSSDELEIYLQAGFDHFSQVLDKPFNFVEVAIRNNPIPQDFEGHILQLAILMTPNFTFDVRDGKGLINKLSEMVASCIVLNCTLKLKGLPTDLFEKYSSHLGNALKKFFSSYWPCNFCVRGAYCVNVKDRHSKGHQKESGKIIGIGPYEPDFDFEDYKDQWELQVKDRIASLQGENALNMQSSDKPSSVTTKESALSVHRLAISRFYGSLGTPGRPNHDPASRFTHHGTCLCCLMGLPQYSLPCGHIICFECAKLYGQLHEGGIRTFEKCPLHPNVVFPKIPWPLGMKPESAGVRILSLDGGGVRGMVELETLKAIEHSLGGKLPIAKFFDLIVGTSTGGILALALGVKHWPVNESIERFMKICYKAFTRRELNRVPVMRTLAAVSHGSFYKTRPLHNALKKELGHQILFGGPREYDSRSVTKVAVTSTDEDGRNPIILANYRHPEKAVNYDHYQPSSADKEMQIWEAAAATSAASSYFKPFYHHASGRSFLDGGLYYNNPVKVAHREMHMLWPDIDHPDILLSLGTGRNKAQLDEEEKAEPHTGNFGHQKSRMGRFGRTIDVLKVLRRRIHSILDAEKAWKDFVNDFRGSDEDGENCRHFRLNPWLESGVPDLADTSRLVQLVADTKRFLLSKEIQQEINDIANHLIASLFYYEKQTSSRPDENYISCQGAIRCRFLSELEDEANYIRALGELLRQRAGSDPHFEIQEDRNSDVTRKVYITDVINQMAQKAYFPRDGCKCDLRVPERATSVKISMWLKGDQPKGRLYLISNFPRKVMMEDLKKVMTKTRSDLKRATSLPSMVPPPDNLKEKLRRSTFVTPVKNKVDSRRTRSMERRPMGPDSSLKRSLSLPREGDLTSERDPSGDFDENPDVRDIPSDDEYYDILSDDEYYDIPSDDEYYSLSSEDSDDREQL